MNNLLFAAAIVPAVAYSNVELEPQIINADRIIESQISNSMIISREKIEQLQASNLSEIFSTLPGFQITKQGGNANTQSFVMNGYRSDQILILLNGQRFGSATLGETTFNTIPADTIQRIEIVSNARSAIYGADALGGVINIITTPEAGSNNSVQIALGNQRTNQFSTNLNKSFGDLSVNLSGFSEKTHGFDVKENTESSSESDSDGSERHTLALGGRYQIDKQQTISANIQANRGSYEYDGSKNEQDFQQQAASINWNYASKTLGAAIQAGRSSDKSWSYGNGNSRADAAGIITENTTLESTVRLALSEQQSLMFVADYREEDISQSTSEFDKEKGSVNGFGISHRFNNSLIGTEVGIRRDDSTQFDENYSQSLSAEWYATELLSVVGAINTGFKAPSFNQLYYPYSASPWGIYQGNSNVKPEQSLNRRLALQYDHNGTYLEAAYQYSHVEDKIQWEKNSNDINTPINLGNVLIRTATASWKQHWSQAFTSQLSYDWTHAIDLEKSKLLRRQAPRNIKLNLNYSNKLVSIGTLINHISEQYDDANNKDSLAAYTAVALFSSYKVSSQFTVGARINNALNRDYQTAKGYPAQERTYLINGTFTF